MATPKRLCACGTTVLFPNNLSARTCWKCNTRIHLEPSPCREQIPIPAQAQTWGPQKLGASLAPASIQRHAVSTRGVLTQLQHGGTALEVESTADRLVDKNKPSDISDYGQAVQHTSSTNHLRDSSRLQFGNQENRADKTQLGLPSSKWPSSPPAFKKSSESLPSSPPAFKKSSESSLSSSSQPASSSLHLKDFLWLLVLLSTLGNAAYFTWRRSAEHSKTPVPSAYQHKMPSRHPHALSEKDTDADGIPDHHDYCPNSALEGWVSSRRTDFDQDGCADNSPEDQDKDGDGIEDRMDKCPFTPQHYGFKSNHANDFDGDGCYDGTEDHDDDNDTIPNNMDTCPNTRRGQMCDHTGCSREQRERKSEVKRPTETPVSKLESWIATLRANGTEVLLGCLFAAVFGRFMSLLRQAARYLREHGTRGAIVISKLRIIFKYSLRAIAFFALICWWRKWGVQFTDGK